MHMTGVEVFRVYRIALGFALVLYLVTACIHTHFQCINHKITCLQCLVAGRIVPQSESLLCQELIIISISVATEVAWCLVLGAWWYNEPLKVTDMPATQKS